MYHPCSWRAEKTVFHSRLDLPPFWIRGNEFSHSCSFNAPFCTPNLIWWVTRLINPININYKVCNLTYGRDSSLHTVMRALLINEVLRSEKPSLVINVGTLGYCATLDPTYHSSPVKHNLCTFLGMNCNRRRGFPPFCMPLCASRYFF